MSKTPRGRTVRLANSKLAKLKCFLPGKFLTFPPDTKRELITTISDNRAVDDRHTGKTQKGTVSGSRPPGLGKPAPDLDAEPAHDLDASPQKLHRLQPCPSAVCLLQRTSLRWSFLGVLDGESPRERVQVIFNQEQSEVPFPRHACDEHQMC